MVPGRSQRKSWPQPGQVRRGAGEHSTGRGGDRESTVVIWGEQTQKKSHPNCSSLSSTLRCQLPGIRRLKEPSALERTQIQTVLPFVHVWQLQRIQPRLEVFTGGSSGF